MNLRNGRFGEARPVEEPHDGPRGTRISDECLFNGQGLILIFVSTAQQYMRMRQKSHLSLSGQEYDQLKTWNRNACAP